MCEGSFLPSSFGPHQKHTEFESSPSLLSNQSLTFFVKGGIPRSRPARDFVSYLSCHHVRGIFGPGTRTSGMRHTPRVGCAQAEIALEQSGQILWVTFASECALT